MTTEKLNHYIGRCGLCDGIVKNQYIEGWGFVPGTAQCINCKRKAKTNKQGILVIEMEKTP